MRSYNRRWHPPRQPAAVTAALTFAGCLFAGLAQAAAPALPGDLARAGTVRAAEPETGDSLALAGGETLRLRGIQAPKPSSADGDAPAWPLADKVRRELARLAQDERLVLYATAGRDRRGRRVAHAVRARDGRWLQGALVAAGWARVYGGGVPPVAAAPLLAAERAARRAERGIWRHPFYAVREAGELDSGAVGTFQVVAGRIAQAKPFYGAVFLNFARDWKGTFSARIRENAVARFRRAGLAPKTLAGKRVRVRGWLVEQSGPLVVLNHPSQLEGPLGD